MQPTLNFHRIAGFSFQPRRVFLTCGLWAILLLAGFQGWTAHAQAVQGAPNADGSIDTFSSGYGPDGYVAYHPQVTAYFCAAASMEMELDCKAVRTQNAVIENMLNGGQGNGANPGAAAVDGAVQACFPPGFCWPAVQFNGNQVVFGAQSYIYGLCHGLNTYNGNTYFNPFWPVGFGTGIDCEAACLNLMDSPANNNAGPHNYVAYNLPSFAWANSTMADAIRQLGIPAIPGINNGGHAICAYGVRTKVVAGKTKIQGFWLRDPWTGFAQAIFPNAPAEQRGLGENKYVGLYVNPDRQGKAWNKLFTPSPGPPLPVFASGYGFKFEVEPIGPIQIDTNDETPPISPILPNSPLTAAQALAYATNDVDNDSTLDSETGFTDGGWDVADAMLVQYPTDTAGEGDWLIPYDGSGGVNDVTGFVLIDEQTGDIDEATWMNPSDAVPFMTLAQIQDMETNEFADNLPNDDFGEPQLSIQGPPTNQTQLATITLPGGQTVTATPNPNPPPNVVTLSWPAYSLATNTYALQQSTNFPWNNWTTLAVTVTNMNGSNIVVLSPSVPQSYFRLISSTNN